MDTRGHFHVLCPQAEHIVIFQVSCDTPHQPQLPVHNHISHECQVTRTLFKTPEDQARVPVQKGVPNHRQVLQLLKERIGREYQTPAGNHGKPPSLQAGFIGLLEGESHFLPGHAQHGHIKTYL